MGFFSSKRGASAKRSVTLRGGVEKKKQGYVVFLDDSSPKAKVCLFRIDKGSIYDGANSMGCKFLFYRVTTAPKYAARFFDKNQAIINGTIQRTGVETTVDAVNDSNLKPFVDAVFFKEANKVFATAATYADSRFFVRGKG